MGKSVPASNILKERSKFGKAKELPKNQGCTTQNEELSHTGWKGKMGAGTHTIQGISFLFFPFYSNLELFHSQFIYNKRIQTSVMA